MIGSALRRSRLAPALAVVIAALALGAPGSAHAAPADGAPLTVPVPVPAPGETKEWDVPVANDSDEAVDVWLTVKHPTGSPELPLMIEIANDAEETVFGPIDLRSIPDESVYIGALDAHSEATFTGRVSMPRDVGNEFQGRSDAVTFTFATADDGESPGTDRDSNPLASTGSTLSWLPFAIALVMLTGGLLVLLLRKRSRPRRAEADACTPGGDPG